MTVGVLIPTEDLFNYLFTFSDSLHVSEVDVDWLTAMTWRWSSLSRLPGLVYPNLEGTNRARPHNTIRGQAGLEKA